MARHKRTKKCIKARKNQELQSAIDEKNNLEAEFQKELALLKAKYQNRLKELNEIIKKGT